MSFDIFKSKAVFRHRERMGAVAIVFIGVLLITELHCVNTVPAPKLSVKLLCELLCEHCNGVANMESEHCHCEVPEAQFKDNSSCLERAQISAAEMNLTLTHFKNTRRERSVSNVLRRINSDELEDAQIHYSEGYYKLSHEPLTTPTPNPVYMNNSEDQTPEHKELRSINNVPAQELRNLAGYQEQSSEHKSFRKRSINHYFQTPSSSYLRSAQLPVFYPRRKKRSYTKRKEFTRKEDETIPLREITKSKENNNSDVIVNVQTGIEIPALKAKEDDNENFMKLKFQGNDDLQSQVSPSLVPDNSTIVTLEPSNPKQNAFGLMLKYFKSIFLLSNMGGTAHAVASNKSRRVVEQQLINNGTGDSRIPTDLIRNSNPLLLPTASSGGPFERTALANETIDHVGKIGSVDDSNYDGNENEPITNINQSTSEPPKKENGSNVSPTQIEVADLNMKANTSNSNSEQNDDDSMDFQYPDKLKGPFVESNVEAVPTDVSSTAPVLGLEPHVMQSDESSQSKTGHIMDAKETLLNYPHFVNHHEKTALTNTPNSFSPVSISPALVNNITQSPEETYHGMFDKAPFPNGTQPIFYPPLLVLSCTEDDCQESVLNIPVAVARNIITLPFDHLNRLTVNFNGTSDLSNHQHLQDESSMLVRAFVPEALYNKHKTKLPPSRLFLVEPLLIPGGNIPSSEVLNQLRTGEAIILIKPINLRDP